MQTFSKAIAFAFLFMAFHPLPCRAEDSGTVIQNEGISGDVDIKRRSPHLSVRTVVGKTKSSILADAYIPNEDYAKYPIQFDFYVNRTLFASQIRSTELPGAVGIDIPRSTASLPFNYTVIARTLHPNREFTTIIYGAVFEQSLGKTLTCSLSTSGATSGESRTFTQSGISSTQVDNKTFTISYEADAVDHEDEHAAVSATISTSSADASGTLTVVRNDVNATVAVSGKAVLTDGTLTSFEVKSSGGGSTLACE